MSQVRGFFYSHSKIRVFLALFLLGLIFGVIFRNLFKDIFLNTFSNWNTFFSTGLQSTEIDKSQLFYFILLKKLKSFLLLWVFSISIIGIPYMIAYVSYKGFAVGILLSSLWGQYGLKGTFILFVYYFPQGFIFVPVLLFVMNRNYELCKRMNQSLSYQAHDKKHMIVEQLPLLLICSILILLGCALEAYFNMPLLKSVLN